MKDSGIPSKFPGIGILRGETGIVHIKYLFTKILEIIFICLIPPYWCKSCMRRFWRLLFRSEA